MITLIYLIAGATLNHHSRIDAPRAIPRDSRQGFASNCLFLEGVTIAPSQPCWKSFVWFIGIVSIFTFVCECPGGGAIPPRTLQPRELALITQILDLSEEQEAQLEALFVAYRENLKMTLLDSQLAQKFNQRRKLLTRAYSRPEHVDESAAVLFQECASMVPTLQAHADNAKALLLEGLESLLSEKQLLRFHRLHHALDRRAYRASRGALPEGNVDLIDILQRWMRDDPIAHEAYGGEDRTILFELRRSLSPEELQYANAFIEDFEPGFAAALKQYSTRVSEAYYYFYLQQDFREQLEDESVTDDLAREIQFQIDEANLKFGEMVVRPDQELVRLNRMALERIKSLLSPDKAQEIERIYYVLSYPEIHPDPANASHLYDAVEAIENLRDDQRTALAGFREIFEQQHAHLSKRMETYIFDRRLISIKGGVGTDLQLHNSWLRLFKVGVEREELNQKQVNVIRSILLPEQWQLMPEWDFEQNPRPRPWDVRGFSKWEDWKLERVLEAIE